MTIAQNRAFATGATLIALAVVLALCGTVPALAASTSILAVLI